MQHEKKIDFFKWKKNEYYQENKVLFSSDVNSLFTEILGNKQKYDKLVDISIGEKQSIYNEILNKESMALKWLSNIINSKDIIQIYKESFPKNYVIEDSNFFNHVKQEPYVILYASKSIKNNKDIVLPVIRGDGYLFKFLKTSLQNDVDVCIAAIESNGINYLSLNQEMKNNKEIIELALSQDANIFVGLSDDVKTNKDLILKTLNSKNAMIFWNEIHYSLKEDEDVVTAFLTRKGNVFRYLEVEQQENMDNIKKAIIGDGFNIISSIPKKIIMDDFNISLVLDYMIENSWFDKNSKFQHIQKDLFFTENTLLKDKLNELIFRKPYENDMTILYKELSAYLKLSVMKNDLKDVISNKKNKINKF